MNGIHISCRHGKKNDEYQTAAILKTRTTITATTTAATKAMSVGNTQHMWCDVRRVCLCVCVFECFLWYGTVALHWRRPPPVCYSKMFAVNSIAFVLVHQFVIHICVYRRCMFVSKEIMLFDAQIQCLYFYFNFNGIARIIDQCLCLCAFQFQTKSNENDVKRSCLKKTLNKERRKKLWLI